MAPLATTPAVEAVGIRRRFGDRVALDGLDLAVPEGACFALLGPNGAGKTTAIGILTTLLRPSAGAARLCGLDVVAECHAVRRAVGLVFQESTLDPDLTPREHLDLYARLYHLARPRARAGEVLELVGLAADADRPARQLSGGLRRRLEIGRGLLHRPRVLFLDEPTLGLDVMARAAIWEHLRELRRSGATTLFLTTHHLEEADALCDEIAILDRGRAVAAGRPEALKAALGGDVVRILLARPEDAQARLEAVEGVRRVAREDGAPAPGAEGVAFRVTLPDGPRRLPALLEATRACGVLEVALSRPSLEHVFLHHTGHRFAEADERGPAGPP
jgi:ABC-2 type transport system ATP-binding protein